MSSQRTVYLTPPRISETHIKEKIVCIRAHRERIFQVSTQLLGGKLICHNYGQGGAGWTFLFGCVNESIALFEEQLEHQQTLKNKPITVIGAGCYGLLTAITLARKGHAVRIIARETTNIPSYKAAGFFFPRPRKSSTPEERAVFEKIGVDSYTTYLQISQGSHPYIKTGAKIVPAYFDPDIDPGFAPYSARSLIAAPEQVTIDFGNGKNYQAMEYKIIFMNSTELMRELQRNITELEIPITSAHVQSFDEIDQEIIFNCAGLGARELTKDPRILPVQGHLITLTNQPPVEQLQYMINVKVVTMHPNGIKKRDQLIYFAPKESGILGITFIRNQDSLTANPHEFDNLIQRCKDFFGSASE